MNKTQNTLGMAVLAGALVAPMLAFGQAANSSTARAIAAHRSGNRVMAWPPVRQGIGG